MKKYIKLIFVGIAVLMLSSCYKTGEIIYQTTCKPIEVGLPNNLIGIFLSSAFHGNIKYGYSNKRPVSIERTDIFKQPFLFYTMEYDESDNLSRVSIFSDSKQKQLLAYTNFNYPPGTTSSIADWMEKIEYQVNPDGVSFRITSMKKYYFNTEFQVEKITVNGKPYSDLEYDYGGNLVKQIVYTTSYDVNEPAGKVSFVYRFDKYDDKINLFRSDRYLQLFFDVYSKNNPESSSKDYGFYPDGTPAIIPYTGNYTYNNFGYWTTCGPIDYFVKYDCYQRN